MYRKGSVNRPNEEPYRAGIYAGLSVERRKNSIFDSIDNQLILLRSYVKNAPYLTPAKEYTDSSRTDTGLARQGFFRMVIDALTGEIDCIIAKDFSKFGGYCPETDEYLKKILPSVGIRVIVITDENDNINADKVDDGAAISLERLVNEAYKETVSKIISTAIRMKQRQGKFMGSQAPYGYMKNPEDKHHLIIDPEAGPIVVRIFECGAKGMGNREIARMLNEDDVASPARYRYEKGLTGNKKYAHSLWNVSTIAVMLANPIYIGDMGQSTQRTDMNMSTQECQPQKLEHIYVSGTHEPIVCRELFKQVQARIGERQQKG